MRVVRKRLKTQTAVNRNDILLFANRHNNNDRRVPETTANIYVHLENKKKYCGLKESVTISVFFCSNNWKYYSIVLLL